MKLSKLLKRTTLLPITLFDGGREGFFIGNPDGQTQICDLRDGMQETGSYMVHAANVLPGLIEAAASAKETMRALHAYNHSEKDRRAILSRSMGALSAVLAHAEEVQVSGE